MKFKIYQIDMDRDKNRVKFDNNPHPAGDAEAAFHHG